jgi:hypothetical protein
MPIYIILIAIQISILIVSITRPALAEILSLAIILILPTAFALHWNATRFLSLLIGYVLFLIYTLRLLKIESWKETWQLGVVRKMDSEAPKRIYKHFLLAHYCAVGISIAGFCVTVYSLVYITRHDPGNGNNAYKFGITDKEQQEIQDQAHYEFMILTSGISLFFEGAYFGVLHRDFARLVHTLISASIQGKVKDTRKVGNCALCGTQLTLHHQEDVLETGNNSDLQIHQILHHNGHSMNSLPSASSASGKSGGFSSNPNHLKRKISGGLATTGIVRKGKDHWKLSCGHEFHDTCLVGWSVVGKRHMSPCCSEKLDTDIIFASSPWQKTSTAWIDITEQARFLIYYFSPLLAGLWLTEILRKYGSDTK